MSKRVKLLLEYREDAVRWKKQFDWSFKKSNPVPFFEHALKSTRCFVGWIKSHQGEFLSPNECYITLSNFYINTVVYEVVERDKPSHIFDTVENCIAYIEKHQLVPLDRGKTPFFAPAAARLAREAINAWCICANRMGVPKDLRRLIGEMMWAERHVWIP